VIVIEPVIETFGAREFTGWPVSAPADSPYLVLSGDLTPGDVGTAMAVIVSCNGDILGKDGYEVPKGPGPAWAIQRLMLAECLVAPGGLRVRDTGWGLTVNPGCCFGLENWRDWNEIADGQSPWLGHDPDPWAEHLGSKIRIWPGKVRAGEAIPAAGPPVDIPAGDFLGLIAGAHQKLQDFLDLLEPWALPLAGQAATGLAPAFAAHFRIGPGTS
jgi:hypothetical protein